MKNRKLNETVNKAIQGQTQGNIDKTMGVLKRRGVNQDPAKIAKQMALGINPTSDGRLAELMKETTLTPEMALKELQDKQRTEEMLNDAANARNSYNDPNRATSGVIQDLERMGQANDYQPPYQRVDRFDP